MRRFMVVSTFPQWKSQKQENTKENEDKIFILKKIPHPPPLLHTMDVTMEADVEFFLK